MTLLIFTMFVLVGCSGGYLGHSRWGTLGGASLGLGTVLLLLGISFAVGLFR